MDDQTLRIAEEPEDDGMVADADPAEVERVLKTLTYLLEVTDSEAIREIIDDACCQIADLVEADDEEAEAA